MGSERSANAHTRDETPSVAAIPVIGDIPNPDPVLGFQELAEAIAGAVKGGNPPQFTVGLYGPWGSGKTSLLKAIECNLSQDKDKVVIPVSFDAWRYERSEHIIVPLLYRILSSVEESAPKKVVDGLKRTLGATIKSLTFRIGTSTTGVSVSGKDFLDEFNNKDRYALDDAFAKPFSELQELPEALRPRRIVVLIDDLDRCSPEKVVSVLESINLVMDVRGFIFVLALDYDVLVSAINTRYPHVSGDAFIQKIIQLPFNVPQLSLARPESLAELMPDWKKWMDTRMDTLPEGLSDHLREISKRGLASNPRQIKRLINSFMLLHRVFIRQNGLNTEDLKFVATLLGLQLRWPQLFRRFQQSTSYYEDSVNWELRYYFQKRNDPDLWLYAEHLLEPRMCVGKIRQALQLTSVVAMDNESSSDASLYHEFGDLDGPEPFNQGILPVQGPADQGPELHS